MADLINAIKATVEAGLNGEWTDMGFGIADIVAKGIDVISGFFG
ncbi:beta-class phenol-soluble modulin [Staphylococcus felis]|nr:beta-class phenol-soluble modulin [Staphylococcus felis]REH77752.1 hemolysin-H1C [Staphylococcus felis]REH96774.1 hemolysin-H1C [Staphylococcus felis]REI05346.1 hemolysin-H1C [Staphylococcus felis]REI14786.1 hemolysin-H1C [Staphylococcus felis]REI26504.1 hemolysin-H1C [Staphylococcus felis]